MNGGDGEKVIWSDVYESQKIVLRQLKKINNFMTCN